MIQMILIWMLESDCQVIVHSASEHSIACWSDQLLVRSEVGPLWTLHMDIAVQMATQATSGMHLTAVHIMHAPDISSHHACTRQQFTSHMHLTSVHSTHAPHSSSHYACTWQQFSSCMHLAAVNITHAPDSNSHQACTWQQLISYMHLTADSRLSQP